MITTRPQFLPVRTEEGWVYINQNFIKYIQEVDEEYNLFFVHGEEEPIKSLSADALDVTLVHFGSDWNDEILDVQISSPSLVTVEGEISCLH